MTNEQIPEILRLLDLAGYCRLTICTTNNSIAPKALQRGFRGKIGAAAAGSPSVNGRDTSSLARLALQFFVPQQLLNFLIRELL